MKKIKYTIYLSLTVVVISLFNSCSKFVEINAPNGSIGVGEAFANDGSATAAILSLYSNGSIRDGLLLTTLYGGLSADELRNNQPTTVQLEFENNNITPTNAILGGEFWLYLYRQIINANMYIDGLEKSTSLTPTVKNQLLGEAKFWRAMTFFNLVNCFGNVPLAMSPVALENALLSRSSVDQVYAQILDDLKQAKDLLLPAYPSTERARVNKYAVSALLARVYLYRKDWVNAEMEATSVIESGVYTMSPVASTFQKTSNETILQIFTLTGFTQWGVNLVPSATTNITYYLRPGFVGFFEVGDTRSTNWTAAIGTSGMYHVNKYKLRTATAGNEYYILLRLAEQHLVRAEARAHRNNLSGTNSAETDLNVVRGRAGLGNKTNLALNDMLLAIEQERKVELFGEYAHRWFDLKRTPSLTTSGKTRADDVLSVVKGANWQSTDQLYPIHTTEIIKNPALAPQNDGYN